MPRFILSRVGVPARDTGTIFSDLPLLKGISTSTLPSSAASVVLAGPPGWWRPFLTSPFLRRACHSSCSVMKVPRVLLPNLWGASSRTLFQLLEAKLPSSQPFRHPKRQLSQLHRVLFFFSPPMMGFGYFPSLPSTKRSTQRQLGLTAA